MNATFSLKRVWGYMKWSIIANKKRHVYFLLLILGFYFFDLITYYLSGYKREYNSLSSALPVIMAFFPIVLDPIMNEKENEPKITFTLPVSSLERFTGMWLKCVLILPLFALTLYLLLNQLSGFFLFSELSDISTTLETFKFTNPIMVYVWFALQSVGMISSISYGQKNQLKASLPFLVITILIISLMGIYNSSEFGVRETLSSTSAYVGFGRIWPSWFVTTMKYYLLLLFPFGMWLASYFKIREKEI